VKTSLLYGVVVLFLTIMSADMSAGVGIGVMLATMHTGYPFIVGEKSNMDALYVTLAVGKKTVVLGRYLFTLLFNICFVLAASLVSMLVVLAYTAFGQGSPAAVSGGVLLVMPLLFMAMQAIQLPLYFKLGYTKAKFVSMVPFFALMVGYFAFTGYLGGIAGVDEALANVFADASTYFIVGVVFLAVVFVSYRLSLVFYRRREF